jgi:hypothetical protein
MLVGGLVLGDAVGRPQYCGLMSLRSLSMFLWVIAAADGCGGPAVAPAPATGIASAPPSAERTAPVAACAFVRLNEAPPSVRTFSTMVAARDYVLADFAGGERIDLPSLAKENAGAFGLSVLWRAYAGSTRLHHNYAVFVIDSKVVVVGTLEDTSGVLTPACHGEPEDAVLEARLGASPRYPHLGHYRFRRLAPRDRPTLPDVPLDSACPQQSLQYRIEDHFVDLDGGKEILVIAEVYRGPFALVTPPSIPPLGAFAFDDLGAVVPPQADVRCDRTFPWPWNDQAEHTP